MQKHSFDQIASQPRRKQSPTASKKNYQFFWKLIFLSITITTSLLLKQALKMQNEQFKQIIKGRIQEILVYGLSFAILFGVVDFKIHAFLDPLCEKYVINHDKYKQSQYRMKRCYTLVKWGYSLFYYSISSIVGLLLLSECNAIPLIMGGSGSLDNIYGHLPYLGMSQSLEKYMKIFYILQFGKHFSRGFCHVFIRQQGNFYQYSLHHGLSTFLILYSFLYNYWIVGCYVLVLHDCSDFFLILARGYRDVRNRKQYILIPIYFGALATWVPSRIIYFMYCCILPSIKALFTVVPRLQQFYAPQYYFTIALPAYFLVAMLILLQILQIFWTYYIIKSFLATTAKIGTHNYD